MPIRIVRVVRATNLQLTARRPDSASSMFSDNSFETLVAEDQANDFSDVPIEENPFYFTVLGA